MVKSKKKLMVKWKKIGINLIPQNSTKNLKNLKKMIWQKSKNVDVFDLKKGYNDTIII